MPADAMERIMLRIGSVDWSGWKSCRITRSVDAVSGAFSLGLADRWTPDAEAPPLAPGMACRILAGQDGLIDGYIDKISPSFSAASHSLLVEGRDRSADLADCSAVHTPGQWVGLDAPALAAVLAEPFGVAVSVGQGVNPGGPFPTFKLQPGESALDALGRALKQRELMPFPDGRGGLVLQTLGKETASTDLTQGKNILSVSGSFDVSERYSDYIVQGQKQGTDQAWGAACSVRGALHDDAVGRYRPLVLRAAQQGDAAYMRSRAAWERTSRQARGSGLTLTVQGWRMDDGKLWPLGALVRVRLPWLRLDTELLISGVTFTASASGSLTQLELKDKNAFQPEPDQPQGSGSGGSGTDWEMVVKMGQDAKKAQERTEAAL